MKTFLVASLLAAFAFVTSVQAGDNTDKPKAATAQAKSVSAPTSACGAEKTSCCAAKVAKQADVSIKGATLLVRR